MAEQYFPGADPIRKQIGGLDLSPKSLKQIIGIVEDIREGPLDLFPRAASISPVDALRSE